MKADLSDLSVHPVNDEIYSHTDLTDLVLSLKTHGQLEPIVINDSKMIISGHRRYFSMIQLGWTECEVRSSKSENEVVDLIEHNRSRVKSVSDILNESRYLEKELKREIGRGRYVVAQRNGKRMETIIEVSKKLGLSTTQLKKIKSISNYEPELINQIDGGDLSVNQAYEQVRERYIKRTSADPQSSKVEFQKKFSKLLSEYHPSQSDIKDVLSKKYPYSVASIKDGEDRREDLVVHLDQLKKLDSREMGLFRKYQEIKRLNPKPSLVKKVEQELWQPRDITNKNQTIKEIEGLEPVIEFVENGTLEEFNIPMRLLFIGDSITYGIGDPNADFNCQATPNWGFPRYLGDMFSLDFPNVQVINRGRCGFRTFEILPRALAFIRQERPGYAIIMVGANDLIAGTTVDWIVPTYERLVHEARALNIVPIIVPTTPYDSSQRIADELWELSAQTDTIIADVHAPLLADLDGLMDDRVHPNQAGHMEIARVIYQAMIHHITGNNPFPSILRVVEEETEVIVTEEENTEVQTARSE